MTLLNWILGCAREGGGGGGAGNRRSFNVDMDTFLQHVSLARGGGGKTECMWKRGPIDMVHDLQ